MWAIGALKHAEKSKILVKFREKYKIDNFEANFSFHFIFLFGTTFSVYHMKNWPIDFVFLPQFYTYSALVTCFQSTYDTDDTYDKLVPFKVHFWYCIICSTFFPTIYGFIVSEMENWPQNCRFCIFDLNFTKILPFLHGPHIPFKVYFWYYIV